MTLRKRQTKMRTTPRLRGLLSVGRQTVGSMTRQPDDFSSSRTRDRFASLIVFAPGPFPGNKTTTLDSKVEQVEKGISAAEARAKHPDALAALSKCRQKLWSSYQLFQQGNQRDAMRELLSAEQLFAEANRLKGMRSLRKTSAGSANSSYQLVRGEALRLDGATIMATLQMAPALLVQRFGDPMPGDGYKVSGEFLFASTSGEAFAVHDWLSTTLYTGTGPTPDQFWASTEELEICVSSVDIDCTNFVEWLANQIG